MKGRTEGGGGRTRGRRRSPYLLLKSITLLFLRLVSHNCVPIYIFIYIYHGGSLEEKGVGGWGVGGSIGMEFCERESTESGAKPPPSLPSHDPSPPAFLSPRTRFFSPPSPPPFLLSPLISLVLPFLHANKHDLTLILSLSLSLSLTHFLPFLPPPPFPLPPRPHTVHSLTLVPSHTLLHRTSAPFFPLCFAICRQVPLPPSPQSAADSSLSPPPPSSSYFSHWLKTKQNKKSKTKTKKNTRIQTKSRRQTKHMERGANKNKTSTKYEEKKLSSI